MIFIATPINIISTSFALRSYDSVDKENPYPSHAFITPLNGKKYLAEYITREKVEEMKKQSELKISNKNYNQIIDGHGTGYAPPTTEDLEKLIGKVAILDVISDAGFQNYRASADISTEIYFPVVGDQAMQGSCTAWANAYYAYGYMEAKDYGWDASSGNPDYLLSPAWAYNMVSAFDYGSIPFEVAELIMDWGVSTLSTMPYNDMDVDSWGEEPAWREAPYHRPLTYSLIAFTGPATIDVIRSLLDSGIPVTIGIDADQFGPGLADNYIISSTEYDSSGSLNHAQCFVGYDDSITDDGDVGAFRVVNSWGLGWGDSGYYWLTYDAFSEFGDDPDQSILYFTDRIDYNPSLIGTWEFSAVPTRMDDIITLGAGPYNSPLDMINPLYDNDIVNLFPEFMALDISDFQTHYNADPDVFFFLDVGPSTTTGIISSFLVERYVGGTLVEISPESPDVPEDTPGYVNGTFMFFNHDIKVLLDVPIEPMIYNTYTVKATVINNGGNDENAIDFELLLDDIPVLSSTISSLLSGENTTFNYLWTPSEYKTYNFTAYTLPVPSETYLSNNIFTEIRAILGLLFFDDFESGLSKLDSITGLWHLTDTSSTWPNPCHSPTHSMWFGQELTGDYDTGYREMGNITTISIDLSASDVAKLEFYHWRESEFGYDESYVKISTDGINWNPIYYTSDTFYMWEKTSLDISAYAGNPSVQIMFHFDTDDNLFNDYRGWLVDDIEILTTGVTIPHDLRVNLEVPDDPELYYTCTINATVTNIGENAESDVDLFLYLDDVEVNSTTISTLSIGESKTINYTWTPTEYKDYYNFTAWALPVSGEFYLGNNIASELLSIVEVHLFDAMYINYEYSNYDGDLLDMMFSYSYYSGDLFSGMYSISGIPYGTWKVDSKTRVMTDGSPFGDNTHTPIWIFTHISLGNEVLIATDGLGDHLYNVADEQTYDLPNFGTVDVWVLEDITIPGSFAWYEKTTGILVKGKFYDGSGYWWFTFDFSDTNADFRYLPETFTLFSTAGGPDDDGDFDLTWSKSDWASSYTAYEYSSFINQINGSLTLLASGITDLTLPLSGYSNGTYYFIVVAQNDYGDTLSDCIMVEVQIPVVVDTITVTNPDGTDSWETDSTHSITWASAGSITDVKIELYKGGILEKVITASTPNDGSFDWTIPTDLVDGIDYKIRISDVSNPATYGESLNFTLTTADTGDGTPGVPGYNLLFLLGIIITISIISIRTHLKRKSTNKLKF